MSLASGAVGLLLLCALRCSARTSSEFKEIGSFPAETPGFSWVGVETGAPRADRGHTAATNQSWTLLLSSFSGSPFSKDGLYYARNVQQSLATASVGDIKPLELSNALVWPNEFQLAPDGVFPGSDVASAATGFLVPGKSKGTISLFNFSSDPVSGPHIATDNSISADWFYHRTTWHDVNHDGRMDILTARAHKPLLGNTKSQFLWLEQPASDPLDAAWNEHVLSTDGPDVFFVLVHLSDSTGKLAPFIISANFFSKVLQLIWPKINTTTGYADWSASSLQTREIDRVDAPFDLHAVDVDSDGTLEVAVSVNNEQNGSFIVYDIPTDFTNPSVPWPKHVVASGYHPISGGVGKGAPGGFVPVCLASHFLANGSCATGVDGSTVLPSFVLSGDDGGSVYILTAASEPWRYSQETILTVEGTAGQVSVAAIGEPHAGTYQIFVPDYKGNKVRVLSN